MIPHSVSRRPALFITVSTPWAIRNYFHTGIVQRLAEHVDVIALTTPAQAACLRRDGFADDITVAEWDSGPERRSWKLLRQLRKKLYMESRRSDTEEIWERYSRRPLYQRIGSQVVRTLGGSQYLQWSLRAVRSVDRAVNRSSVFSDLFRGRRTALLFATHADTYFEESVLRSAASQGIPAALMVLSWDHLSTKVVLGPAYRRILVWTELQREELLATYPWASSEQVRVIGIPHYDPYFLPGQRTRTEWCSEFGLDPARPTLVVYTMPQVRHQEQHVIVERLAEAIVRGVEVPASLQVLVKCHPFDDVDRYAGVISRYPHVKLLPTTLPPGADPLNWLPHPSEIQRSRECLQFADVTANIYSTVTIEAALFDKPIVHIAFDPGPLQPGRVPCREYYNFTHFRPITDSGASTLALSQEDFHRAIRDALERPDERSVQRRALAERFMGPMDGASSERVITNLLELLEISTGERAADRHPITATIEM